MKKRGIKKNELVVVRIKKFVSTQEQLTEKKNIGVKQKSDLIHHQDVLRILDGRGTKGSRGARE